MGLSDNRQQSTGLFGIPWKHFIGYVLLLCLALVAVVLGLYLRQFYGPFSKQSANWEEFGEYFGGVLGPGLSFIALLVVAYTSVRVPRELEEQRLTSEKVKTVISLSQMLYDRQFYIYIVAPVWEIRVKWNSWTGPLGDDYRTQVVASYFIDPGSKFETPEDAAKLPFLNRIRFDDHFMPADWHGPSSGSSAENHAINQLSEHQALTIWIRFWCNIATLLEEKLIEEEHVRNMFSDFYSWWLDLMLPLRLTGQEVFGELAKTSKNKVKALPRWCGQLKYLEEILYVGESRTKTYDPVAKAATSAEAKEMASRIVQTIASKI